MVQDLLTLHEEDDPRVAALEQQLQELADADTDRSGQDRRKNSD